MGNVIESPFIHSMIYSLSLSAVSIGLGLFLAAAGAALLARPDASVRFLKALPRSPGWGSALFLLGAGWFFALMATIDLMEYGPQRGLFLWIIVIGSGLVLVFAREFLAVRGLGILFLLAAQVLLDAAFLREDPARLIITLSAYTGIVFACFWVGAPYTLRDQIAWLTASPRRLRLSGLASTGFGAVLVFLGIFVY